jgi:hypothetical protein
MNETKSKPDYSVNQLVLYILAAVTAGEFVLGVIASTGIAPFMLAIAMVKAVFIVVNYMNIGRLFSTEEGHE